MITSKVVAAVCGCTIAASAVSVGLDVNEMLQPAPIEGTGSVSGPVVANSTAMVEWTLTKRTDCTGQSARVWSGAEGFYMVEPYRVTAIPRTEAETAFRIPTEIPKQAPAGLLELRIIGYYECEPGQRDHFTLGPVTLEVIENG